MTGANASGAEVGPSGLLAAAAVGAVFYGVLSALALLAAIGFGSLMRPLVPALAGAASARALAGGVLFLVVVHGLDRGFTVEPAWIPVALGLALGLRAIEPAFGPTLAMGAFVIACVTLAASHAALLDFPLHASWVVIMVLGIAIAVPWRHSTARWRIPLALGTSAVALLAAFTLGHSPQPSLPVNRADRKPPNVLLITVDTLRADAVGAYGGPANQTPNLDRAAARGTIFLHAYSPAPWTLPALSAIFTVRRPADLRRGPYTYGPDDSWVPLAERFRARGYESFAVIANPLLIPFTKGFDDVRNVEHEVDSKLLRPLPVFAHLYWLVELARGRVAKPDTTQLVTESALDFLAREHETPFLLWVHMLDPHDPYQPPAEWRGPLQSGQRTFFAPKDLVGDPSVTDLQNGLAVDLDDAFWTHVRNLYNGEVHYVDASIGRILETLEARGLGANTLVVITADHGEEFLDHGSYYHGQSVYDELIRVPLIFIGPRVRPGRVISSRVSSIDLVPTLEAYSGLDTDAAHRERSLLPYLTGDGPEPRPRDILAEGTNTGEPRRALVAGDDKLILHTRSGRTELYDLAADPRERRDIAAQHPELVAALRKRLDAISNGNGPLHSGLEDPKVIQDLRALGYVQ